MQDDFGDRMKVFEMAEAGRNLMPLLPICARIDGKCFSSFTSDMDRPYDTRLSNLMVGVTRWLVEETNACIGYTQSDEISLAWLSTDYKSQIIFNGRIQKLCSVLASMTTAVFASQWGNYFLNKMPGLALFDCRVWNVPDITEGANVFLWREKDATKNSVSMAARDVYSHKELHNASCSDMQEMLFRKGINWNNYPDFFKRGTFVQRRMVYKKFSAEELERLPLKHEARSDPELMVERSEYVILQMPPFSKVTNRPEVIFFGASPIRSDDK